MFPLSSRPLRLMTPRDEPEVRDVYLDAVDSTARDLYAPDQLRAGAPSLFCCVES